MKTLVLGIGNPILGDDGVGFHVAQQLGKEIKDRNIDIKDTSAGGLNLLELMVGYDKLIVIDAIMTIKEKVGEIYRLKPENIGEPSPSTPPSHHLNLNTTIEIGKRLFVEQMPKDITVFAVGTQQVARVTEEMTGKVKEAIPRVITLVLKEINPALVE